MIGLGISLWQIAVRQIVISGGGGGGGGDPLEGQPIGPWLWHLYS